MKLLQVLKGYKNCECVRIQYMNRTKCEWNGKSIYHIVEEYCPYLLDHEVEDVYVDRCGRRNIVVSLETKQEKIDRLEEECVEAFIPVVRHQKTTESSAIIFINKLNELVNLTGLGFKFVAMFIIRKAAIVSRRG